jgi:hypothetical protein
MSAKHIGIPRPTTIIFDECAFPPQCTVVNKYKEPLHIYIGRGSKWGNPFVMNNSSDEERNRVCDMYEEYFWTTDLKNHLHELKGRKLGCFCKPKRCHGDFLAKLVNEL